MVGWAIRCALLVALGVVAVYELGPMLRPTEAEPGEGRSVVRAVRPQSSDGAARQEESFGSELAVPAGEGGHFYLDANVNGAPLRFLVDTGATFVVLSKETAADLGIRPAGHEYTVRMQTANGIIESAPVHLRQVQIGNFTARDVEALVTDTSLGGSLLGLSFLKRLQSYEVQRDRLVLRW